VVYIGATHNMPCFLWTSGAYPVRSLVARGGQICAGRKLQ